MVLQCCTYESMYGNNGEVNELNVDTINYITIGRPALRKKAVFCIQNDKTCATLKITHSYTFEPRHEISNNVVCATSKASDQPAHMRSLI